MPSHYSDDMDFGFPPHRIHSCYCVHYPRNLHRSAPLPIRQHSHMAVDVSSATSSNKSSRPPQLQATSPQDSRNASINARRRMTSCIMLQDNPALLLHLHALKLSVSPGPFPLLHSLISVFSFLSVSFHPCRFVTMKPCCRSNRSTLYLSFFSFLLPRTPHSEVEPPHFELSA